MAINKERIHDLVEIFYQAPFKTFYVNSPDGQNFTKNLGVFVSLGITTSPGIFKKIRDVMTRVEDGRYKTSIVELCSINISGQYLNSVTKTTDVEQYDIEEFPEDIWNREEALELMEDLPEETAQEIGKLISKIDSDPEGWKISRIYLENGEYKIFHTKINYRKVGDSEYRIGVYVEEKI